jgi:hypothetical protein
VTAKDRNHQGYLHDRSDDGGGLKGEQFVVVDAFVELALVLRRCLLLWLLLRLLLLLLLMMVLMVLMLVMVLVPFGMEKSFLLVREVASTFQRLKPLSIHTRQRELL